MSIGAFSFVWGRYESNGWQLLESVDNAWEDDLLGKDLATPSNAAAM